MNKFLLVLFALAWITAGCKNDKKVSLTGDEPVEAADFIEFFPQVQLPFVVSDTTLSKKISDAYIVFCFYTICS